MKVKELIERLETYNPELSIAIIHGVGTDSLKLSPLLQLDTVRQDQNKFLVLFDESTRAAPVAEPVAEPIATPLPEPLPETPTPPEPDEKP